MKNSFIFQPQNLAFLYISKFCLPNHSFFSSSFSHSVISGTAKRSQWIFQPFGHKSSLVYLQFIGYMFLYCESFANCSAAI